MRASWLVICLLSFLGLTGCIPIIVGGAAAGATYFILKDHRSQPDRQSDNQIKNNIVANLNLIPALKHDCHITVTVYQGVALLTGEAPTQTFKDKAGEIAATTPHVKKLYNEISIEAPTSKLIRMNDLWLSTRIKTAFMSSSSLKNTELVIVVENGKVYLLGQLTDAQLDVALNKLQSISGIRKIVKLLDKQTI